MLVTNRLERFPSGGRELLCKLNHDALLEIYGDRLVLFELPRSPVRGLRSAINAFRGHIDGLNEAVIAKALEVIQAEKVGKVFVDGSNLGEFVNAAKQRLPEVEISTFFHNVEAWFFLGALGQSKTPRALAVLLANYLAERKSVRHSDNIICLSERDSRLLRRLYSRAATHVSPMAMKDKLPMAAPQTPNQPHQRFALFVGSVFYANLAGITWFVKEVAPRIGIKICIVGSGFEAFRDELELDGKVEVVGSVDSLADWYSNSHFVIAPIFSGSGMKTKVAEAMMFGKKVVGTPEAFSGYEDVADRAGWECATADDFVTAIKRAGDLPLKSFDPELRALYEERYSYSAARSRMAKIIGSAE